MYGAKQCESIYFYIDFLLEYDLLQLHHLFNLAHSYRVAVHKERPLDHILKVLTSTLILYIPVPFKVLN